MKVGRYHRKKGFNKRERGIGEGNGSENDQKQSHTHVIAKE